MDDIDKSILNQIQSDFPISARPYQVLGQLLGLKEEDVLERVRRLRRTGVIRRIGGNFFSHRLGYASTLCAARVPEDKLTAFVDCVNKFEGVTHNYRRNHELNVWFTFIGPSIAYIESCLSQISEITGVKEIYNLPALKIFKIKVDFRFED
ncbi:MAG: AsnC family transcriptional regulator [Deltaproteobacteria bacterium]|nr:AsnC family transcriptional regulator [Deltaproteobacteria bacterium]